MKSVLKKIWSSRIKGSFTIEAAVIVPIIFLIVTASILISYDIHNSLVSEANEISEIIALGPKVPDNVSSDLVDISRLNGRQILLKYRLVKDGIKKITGGLADDK